MMDDDVTLLRFATKGLNESALGYSRRRFLRQFLGASALAVAGLDPLFAQTVAPSQAASFRFAFLTDLHLLQGGALRSVEGIVACLAAVEKLDPRPEFILCRRRSRA